MKRLACILTLALAGCQSSGTADGGAQKMERVEVKPDTRDITIKGVPPDQLVPLWPMLHPEVKK